MGMLLIYKINYMEDFKFLKQDIKKSLFFSFIIFFIFGILYYLETSFGFLTKIF